MGLENDAHTSRGIASSPGEEGVTYSAVQWKDWLKKEFPSFSGNYESAGSLLVNFCSGLRYVRDKFHGRFTTWKCPNLYIVTSDSLPVIAYGPDQNLILIRLDFLEYATRLNRNRSYDIKRASTKELLFEGTYEQFFGIAGVEECHHSIFNQIASGELEESDQGKNLVEYDADKHEYNALRWQLKYAEEKEYPENSIRILRERLRNAMKERMGRSS